MKKVILSMLAVLLLSALFFGLKLFIIGEPVDGYTVYCDVSETDNQININIATPASAVAFTDRIRLHQEDTTLYITMYKVMVSRLFDDGTHRVWIEKNDLTDIYLGGKLIWSKG